MHKGGICSEGLNILNLGMLEKTSVPHLLPSCFSPLPAKGSILLDLPVELLV